jgi:hypothetical protein
MDDGQSISYDGRLAERIRGRGCKTKHQRHDAVQGRFHSGTPGLQLVRVVERLRGTRPPQTAPFGLAQS